MAEYGGWTGKVLRVDLSTGAITTEDTIAKYKDYLGGAGLGYKVLWDEVPKGVGAFDPENRIIYGVGPLTGTQAPTSGRCSITTLWPMAPAINGTELPGTGHMGGHWGAELKFAGYDALIIQGKAANPVWIQIIDSDVQIKDASSIWGQGILSSTLSINQMMGSEAHVCCIGQAGENQVRLAKVCCDLSHSGGGAGGVMGSKNLKAIGVLGTGRVNISADKDSWHELVVEWLTLMGANSGGVVPANPEPWAEYYGGTRWTATEGLTYGAANPPVVVGDCPPDNLNKLGLRTHKGVLDFSAKDPATGKKIGELITVRMDGCHSCPVRCHIDTYLPRLAADVPGASPYAAETCAGWAGGSMMPTSKDPWIAAEQKIYGTQLADDYGIWCNYSQFQADFKYAYNNGIIKDNLSEAEYNSIPWDLYEASDPAWQSDLYRRIAYKIGEFGEALGEGSYRLQKRWNFPDSYYLTEKKNWKMGHPLHHSVEAAGQAGVVIQWLWHRDASPHTHNSYIGCGLPNELKLEIMNEVTGMPDSLFPAHNYQPVTAGFVRFAVLSMIYMEMHNSVTMCDYNGVAGAWVSPLRDKKYRGDPDIEAKILSAVTGDTVTREEYEKIGMRILTLFRALTTKYMNDKDQRNNHDTCPPWLFDWPGYGDVPAFTPGSDRMDRADIEKTKDLFYQQMGWDVTTGVPTRATLEDLNLGFVADELAKLGLLP